MKGELEKRIFSERDFSDLVKSWEQNDLVSLINEAREEFIYMREIAKRESKDCSSVIWFNSEVLGLLDAFGKKWFGIKC